MKTLLQDVLKTFWRRLENIFVRRLEDILKTSWRRLENVLKASSRYLDDVFARCLEEVLKTSWKRLSKTSWRCLEDVLQMSWRRLTDVLKTSSRYLNDVYARRLEDVLKTSSEDVWVKWIYSSWWRRLVKTKTKDVFKTSSSRRMFAGLDISLAITVGNSPLGIGSSQTRTENVWFPSVSR